jgi:hypothetical protein
MDPSLNFVPSAMKTENFVRTFEALEARPFWAAGRENRLLWDCFEGIRCCRAASTQNPRQKSRHAEAKSGGVGAKEFSGGPSARARSEGRERQPSPRLRQARRSPIGVGGRRRAERSLGIARCRSVSRERVVRLSSYGRRRSIRWARTSLRISPTTSPCVELQLSQMLSSAGGSGFRPQPKPSWTQGPLLVSLQLGDSLTDFVEKYVVTLPGL